MMKISDIDIERIIRAHMTPSLQSELNYYREVAEDSENPSSLVEVFFDIQDRIDETEFMNGSGRKQFSPSVVKRVRRIMIALGMYKAISEEHLKNIYVSSGKQYDFILDGQKYVFKNGYDEIRADKQLIGE